MRYYDHDRDRNAILASGEAGRQGFPRLSKDVWDNFVFRTENRGGKYFLVEEKGGLIETLICTSIKLSPLYKASAYLSSFGALTQQTLSSAITKLSSNPEINFFQCKSDDGDEARGETCRACGFQPYEQEFYMAAVVSAPAAFGEYHDVSLQRVDSSEEAVAFIAEVYNTAFVFDISYTERRSAFFKQCVTDGDDIFVIHNRGEPAGYIHLQPEGQETWMDAIALSSRHRGKGLAYGALNALARRLEPGTRIKLGVSSKNVAAITLYEKFGFSRTRSETRFLLPLMNP